MEKFSLIISSDPQYPWYDGVYPNNLDKSKEKENSSRQITQQYRDMSCIQEESDLSKNYPVQGVVINGDLTSFGHEPELNKMMECFEFLSHKIFPSLGNHDYKNNVHDTLNDQAATRMVKYMFDWLKYNQENLNLNFDFIERKYYKFPELRTDFIGSLAYSFNIPIDNENKVHLINLQNYPSYTNEWNSWNTSGARRDFFYIKSSYLWFENDLAIARNRGDIIIVFVHDVGDEFSRKSEDYKKFALLLEKYSVSAVFAGHIHSDCGRNLSISEGILVPIPFFRSGSASYQNYLIALFELDNETPKMKIVKRESKTLDGKYTDNLLQDGEIKLLCPTPNPPLPVPSKYDYVTFFNEGGYVARFFLTYEIENEKIECKTGRMALENKKTFDIPIGAVNIHIKAECDAVYKWSKIFDIDLDTSPNKCYKVYGTVFAPKWNNNCN